jgi:YesN/AraC family two-component response regulator
MDVKKKSTILWLDFRYPKQGSGVDADLVDSYDVYVIGNTNDVEKSIDLYRPDIIFFDCDLPDQLGLSVLRDIKRMHPSIPFIMLTEDHSIDLVVWALRSRAWDYFIKPVSANEIITSIEVLLEKLSSHKLIKRNSFMPVPDIPSAARPYKIKANSFSTLYAADYVQQHLAKKISVENVARRCGMSKSHFSRTFKKEHGLTFQEFLIKQRMNKAVELLKNTDLHVTQIAFAVGYCELSNFTSIFQRSIGIGPSSFRKALMPHKLNHD